MHEYSCKRYKNRSLEAGVLAATMALELKAQMRTPLPCADLGACCSHFCSSILANFNIHGKQVTWHQLELGIACSVLLKCPVPLYVTSYVHKSFLENASCLQVKKRAKEQF